MSLPDSKKRLALSVIDFLNTSLKDGTLTADDAESIEIATNCIADAFKHLHPSASASTATASGPNPEAEKLKSAGNAAMQQKDYKTAIDKYTQAISFAPTNPIYLSNRAAAYSAHGDHASAVTDAEIAVAADPKYTKAWSRLGLARFALGDARGSVDAYQKGIEHEGNGGSEAMKKGLETAKRELARIEAEEANLRADDNPDALNSLMSNPMIQNLVNQRREGGGAGGMPDMSQIQQMMQDPTISNLAQHDQGYWTPSTTSDTWWTPTTTCYTSYYTPTSTWTTVWTQNEVIVTVTSYLPCPATSTVIYYTQTCQECCYGCGETTEPAVGVTTVTSYTTFTPGQTESTPGQVVTTTSNGYVIIITTTNTAANAQPTVSVYQVTDNVATTLAHPPWLSAVGLALFTCLIAAL
ncbi:hypothetical protein DV736_g3397, partial [Chaetothyriales sp. CBS 134916]